MQRESERNRSVSDWSWKLRLFLSADLVGSTAFKASKIEKYAPDWAPTFKDFFREFPPAIQNLYAQLPERFHPCSEKIAPWKFSGDEILFWVKLEDHREAASHLWVFREAVRSFPDQWIKKGLPLRLKATGWLAGFPVTNSEIQIGQTLDFIGPSIDLGFRITKYSDVRRFPLSADLALMLLDAIDQCEIKDGHFNLFFHGREQLKGVMGNEPYPIVWLDTKDGKLDVEEELLGVNRVSDPHKLKQFLRSFFDNASMMRRPFIKDDKGGRYHEIPAALEDLRLEMEAEGTDRTYLTATDSDQNETVTGPVREMKELPDLIKPEHHEPDSKE